MTSSDVEQDEFPVVIESKEISWEATVGSLNTGYYSRLSSSLDSLREHLKIPVIQPQQFLTQLKQM